MIPARQCTLLTYLTCQSVMRPTWQCKEKVEELRQHEVLQRDQQQSPKHVELCSPGHQLMVMAINMIMVIMVIIMIMIVMKVMTMLVYLA